MEILRLRRLLSVWRGEGGHGRASGFGIFGMRGCCGRGGDVDDDDATRDDMLCVGLGRGLGKHL